MRVDYNSADGQALAQRYLVHGHPTIVIIDRSGTVQETIIGVPTRERVEQAIKQLAP